MDRPRRLVAAPLTLSCLLPAVGAIAQGDGTADDEVAWLQKHAIPMASLKTQAADQSDDAFADLEPLRKHIGEARIVMLGEQTHGDGAAFLAKTRLIAFLHEKMGFDVLCFESGLFECEQAWRSIQGGTHARAAMRTAVFPIWMQSQQVVPLADYVERRARSDRPLELCGYDCQLTGSAAGTLPAVLEEIATLCYPGDDGEESKDPLLRGHKAVVARLPMPESCALRFGKTIQILRDEKCTVKADMPTRRRFAILLESLTGFSAAHAVRGDESATLAQKFNPRDEQGGRNMVWLANERFAGRKIVVWAASMHLVRNHTDIDTGPKRTLDYTDVRSMGDHAAEALGDDVFVIACTTYAGKTGLPWREPRPVLRAHRGSLEELCKRAGLDNAIIPLRGVAKDSFLDRDLYARPLGNSPMRARWPEHVDAFVFQKTMTPSTLYERR